MHGYAVFMEVTETTSAPLESSPPLAGERVALTGTLASMTHAQAAEVVRQQGGEATEHVSRQTTMLVVGEEGWPLEEDGSPSVKLRDVEQWNKAGGAIRIVEEADFLHLVGLSETRDEVRRLYTPATLSTLLDVDVRVIRSWERAGLIRPVRKVYRLPYFDFREVNSVRKLTELLDAGVPRSEIEQTLRHLPGFTNGIERPLEQLQLLARDRRVVLRDQYGLIIPSSGQRLFDFDPQESTSRERCPEALDDAPSVPFLQIAQDSQQWSARDWFVEGCRRHADDDIPGAIESFRLSLMTETENPEAHYYLAECLYRQRKIEAALERYYVAAEEDHEYLEAWIQIGSLHRELGEPEQALHAFEIALDIHPDFAEAHYHKAEVLCELGRDIEAVDHWEAYLEQDSRGPWAENARQRLEFMSRDTAQSATISS
jgi:DNA-binding transcriptional MerR regulator